MSTGRSAVPCCSRRQATNRPSGETFGLPKSNPDADSSTRRLPLAVSMRTSSQCDSPAGCHCHQPVMTDAPSGVSVNASPSSARPGSGVRSRRPGEYATRSV